MTQTKYVYNIVTLPRDNKEAESLLNEWGSLGFYIVSKEGRVVIMCREIITKEKETK